MRGRNVLAMIIVGFFLMEESGLYRTVGFGFFGFQHHDESFHEGTYWG